MVSAAVTESKTSNNMVERVPPNSFSLCDAARSVQLRTVLAGWGLTLRFESAVSKDKVMHIARISDLEGKPCTQIHSQKPAGSTPLYPHPFGEETNGVGISRRAAEAALCSYLGGKFLAMEGRPVAYFQTDGELSRRALDIVSGEVERLSDKRTSIASPEQAISAYERELRTKEALSLVKPMGLRLPPRG